VSLRLNAGTTLFDEGESASPARDYAFTLGASLGYAGFQFGVGFGQTEADDGTDQVIGFGVQYDTGPWMFGVQYGQRLDARPTRVRAASGSTPAIFETFDDSFTLSGEVMYRLAPGVTTGVAVEHASDSFTTSGPYDGSEAAYSGTVYLMLSF
jgi:predicted porin